MQAFKGKGMALVLAIFLALVFVGLPAFSEVQALAQNFKDLPKTAWYTDYVMSLADLGIVKGYGDSGEYRPMSPVTREHATKMLALASQVDLKVKMDLKPDASVISQDTIKRSLAAKMIQVAFGLDFSTKEVDIKDLPRHDPDLAEAIEILASNGVVKGYGQSHYFKPDNPVNRAEFAKMLCMAMTAKAIQEAEALGNPGAISQAEIQVDRLSKTQDREAKAFLEERLDRLKELVNQEPIYIYKVTFDLNYLGAGPGEEKKSSYSKVKLPGDPIRTGYTFKGWNTQADGQGEAFTEESLVKGHLRVYAQWEEGEPDYEALLLLDLAEQKDRFLDHVVDLRTTDLDPWALPSQGSHGTALAWGFPYTPMGYRACDINHDLMTLSFPEWNETESRTSYWSLVLQKGPAKRVLVLKVVTKRYTIPVPDARRFSWRISEHGLFSHEFEAAKALLVENMEASGGPDVQVPSITLKLPASVGVPGTRVNWEPVRTQYGMEAAAEKTDEDRSLILFFPSGKDYNPNFSTIAATIALPDGSNSALITFMIITVRRSQPTLFSWAMELP